MTDRTLYQLERAVDALSLAVQYLKEDTQTYEYSISGELSEINPYTYYSSTPVSERL